MDPGEVARRKAEAKVLLGFAVEVYRFQLPRGCHSLHEHPAGFRSWTDKESTALLVATPPWQSAE